MTVLRTVRGEHFFGHPRRALSLGAGFLAIFVVLALVIPSQPLTVEQRWADWMSDIQTPLLRHVALIFNFLGRGLGRAIVLVGIGVVLIIARRWWALLAYATTEALTPLVSSVVKALVDRARPPDGLVHPTGASFPSGHAAFAGATCIAAVLLFAAVDRRRSLWWALASAGIAAMAWSRTYLQVHWLLDVAAGSLLGAGVALVAFAGLQLELSLRPHRTSSPETPASD